MYKVSETTDKTKMTDNPPFGPGFSPELAANADLMEVWGTSANDPGEDFCKFILKKKDGQEIAEAKVPGY